MPLSPTKGPRKFAINARNPDTTNEIVKNSFVDFAINLPPNTSPPIAKITFVIIVNDPPLDTFITNAQKEPKI